MPYNQKFIGALFAPVKVEVLVMDEFESPAYYLDLLDRSNCSRIESAKPGQEIPVLVRREDDRTKKPIGAVGTRSQDGQNFSVAVRREDGKLQAHSWPYAVLLESISMHNPD